MRLLPRLNTILAAVDEIHDRVGHVGGRLDLARVRDAIPGLLVRVTGSLPGHVRGMLHRRRSVAIVLVRADLPRAQQRFAFAHELGHALLHHGHLGRRPLRPPSAAVAERQAHCFAGHLLAPLWAVDLALPPEWQWRALPARPPDELVDAVASSVDVSRTVARIQLWALAAAWRAHAGQITTAQPPSFRGREMR